MIRWYFKTRLKPFSLKNLWYFLTKAKNDYKLFLKILYNYNLLDKFILFKKGYYDINAGTYKIILNAWKNDYAFDHTLLKNLFIPTQKYKKLIELLRR
jgi:hypothetical protein